MWFMRSRGRADVEVDCHPELFPCHQLYCLSSGAFSLSSIVLFVIRRFFLVIPSEARDLTIEWLHVAMRRWDPSRSLRSVRDDKHWLRRSVRDDKRLLLRSVRDDKRLLLNSARRSTPFHNWDWKRPKKSGYIYKATATIIIYVRLPIDVHVSFAYFSWLVLLKRSSFNSSSCIFLINKFYWYAQAQS